MRLKARYLFVATLALPLACGGSAGPVGPVDPTWVAKDTGLLQCAPSLVFTLEEHLAELELANITTGDSATGSIAYLTCQGCNCRTTNEDVRISR